MATRRKSGLVPVVIVAVAAVALFGANTVIDTVTGWFSGGTEIIGEGDTQLMVASNAESKAKQCPAAQILKDRRCGDTKILVMDAQRMPYITRNIEKAWGDGKQFILTRNSPMQRANRAKACGGFVQKYPPKGSCDEYPFATTDEGGAGARTEEVHLDEQNCQGGMVSRGYQLANISNGDKFLVVISNPSKIAARVWQGEEVKSQQC